MNTNIARVIRSARAAGIITFHHSPRGLQPSLRAASSSSTGTPRKLWRSRKMPKAVAAWGMISAQRLLRRPICTINR